MPFSKNKFDASNFHHKNQPLTYSFESGFFRLKDVVKPLAGASSVTVLKAKQAYKEVKVARNNK
ncbi:hypothetical protein [Microscilla marina]|uniref:Uncharacterized protein n=1 Tax=Microscilla marina ATCC 23134 TaxID=313606 RepID=A1ZFR9_MICM2|nr:hypothetical protein [Microscilla marina]EAY30843.1 hypothetical protein M23134_01167 [Microscilla marina ATCC 23134]